MLNKRDSVASIDSATASIKQVTEKQPFRLTERMSSIYSKSFFPESMQLVDPNARMEAILENRSRNFEASQNLTMPNQSLNMTHMNATTRSPLKAEKKTDGFSALPVKNVKLASVFDEQLQTKKKSLIERESLMKRDSSKRLPTIQTQNRFNDREHYHHKRRSSMGIVHEYQKLDQLQSLIDSQSDMMPVHWEAVPTTLSTFKKRGSIELQPKTVMTVPLSNLIAIQATQPMQEEISSSPSPEELRAIKLIEATQTHQMKSQRIQQRILPPKRIRHRKGSQPVSEANSSLFNQLRVMPIGQRPNNKGMLLTQSNMVQLRAIQQLAMDKLNKQNERAKKVASLMRNPMDDQPEISKIKQKPKKQTKVVSKVVRVDQTPKKAREPAADTVTHSAISRSLQRADIPPAS